CDDGNCISGDGCDASCHVEKSVCGMACNVAACKKSLEDATTPFCGNGRLDQGEQCDDGNCVSGDGCSAQCTNEPGAAGTLAETIDLPYSPNVGSIATSHAPAGKTGPEVI